MGFSDDLKIIGLENDYRTLKEGAKDEFELHLRRIRPMYTEVADINGNKSKKFCVSSGNSSPQMDITEVANYINGRFETIS